MPDHGYSNRALAGAWRKGYEAAKRGELWTRNPYLDKRSTCGHVTFSRAFRKAWSDGWEAGMRGSDDRASAFELLWRAAKAYHEATQDPERTEVSQAAAFEELIEAVHLADYHDVVDGCCPFCGRR